MSLARYITSDAADHHTIHLLISGIHCPSCVTLIEKTLHAQEGVEHARLNLSTQRLQVTWHGDATHATDYIAAIEQMGYHAVAFDPNLAETAEQRHNKWLLRCLAVAGFASGNLMMFSVPLWSSDAATMGEATRAGFHWLQAAIAIPTVLYAGQPFFRSARDVLRKGRTNMDVPISVALVLTLAMSLFETMHGGNHAYFDSAVMLVFFLLIGRYLEARARGKARGAAQDLLQLMSGHATCVIDGTLQQIALDEITEGMHLRVMPGERIGADGIVIHGQSEVDTSILTGESLPQLVRADSQLFAGTINLSAPLDVRVTKTNDASLLANIVRLMEVAEQGQAKYVTLADRLARWYTPLVHALAALTFGYWYGVADIEWQPALLIAATVLIVTCPCALGLAVPVAQVLATSKLMRWGTLLKSGDALERLARVSVVVFDKTGTLTLGKPTLRETGEDPAVLARAAALAHSSHHPLARELSRHAPGATMPENAQEIPGMGVAAGDGVLGRRSWVAPELADDDTELLELWYRDSQTPPTRFTFDDTLRPDAVAVIAALRSAGLAVQLLSGDRVAITHAVGNTLNIAEAEGGLSPIDKTQRIQALRARGEHVLMVGDGLNDAPSLAAADVSMSPSSALHITQNAADIVFQGERLAPVLQSWKLARFTQRLVKQNFMLALLYNIIAVPLAVAGLVTPLIAALAMSGSSLIVITNAMRLQRMKAE